MALTTLDPQTALIVVDLQKGIVANPTAPLPAADVLARAGRLADAFRALHLPVVLVNVTGTAPGRTEAPARMKGPLPDDWAELVPELGFGPNDILVTKRTWGAFASTNLDAQLKALAVTQVVIVGIATATGVEATARQAYEAGYNVALAIDAMTDRSAEAHDYAIAKVFPRLGETGTTDDVLTFLRERGA